AAVFIAMLASLSILPAGLAVLGHRINAIRIPSPRSLSERRQVSARQPRSLSERRRVSARQPRSLSERRQVSARQPRRRRPTTGAGAWARVAQSVMRRPWLYVIGVLVILVVLAAPVTRITFGGADTRVLPTDSTSRIVDSRIGTEFPATSTYPVQVLATGVD